MSPLAFPSPVRLWRTAALLVLTLAPAWAASPPPAANLAPLEACFAAQSKIRSISADFLQTRALKTLKSPLAIKGRFWFASPDRFRWQLGDPPKTIIIGSRSGATILHPLKKRAEKVAFSSPNAAGASEFLGLMQLNSSRSLEEFQKHMHILSLKPIGPHCRVEMLPKDAAAAKGLSALCLDFDPATGHWIGFEVVTKEGSSLRTEFSNVQLNTKLDGRIFECDLTGFTLDEKGR